MKNRGFSLMELMIVVAIIMIMGAGGLWAFKNRLYKDEVLKLKTSIPTLIGNTNLRVYERAISGAAIEISGTSGETEDTIKATGPQIDSSNISQIKSKRFDFITSPSGITSFSINSMGTFTREDFSIIVRDHKTNKDILEFTINSKPSLGVYSLNTSQSSF